MRLFVAAWPSEEAAGALAALPRPELPGVRWSTPAQWHVTLAFLGAVEEPLVPGVQASLDALAGRGRARAVLGPATEILGRDGALVAPVAGLSVLAQVVRAELAENETAVDERPFHGHLTLARARRRQAVADELVGIPIAADWDVPAIALVASTLAPGGSRYETIGRVALGG